MRTHSDSFVRPVRDGQRGQSLALVALLLPVLLGMAAITLDLAHIYISYEQLVAATNAAALAGGAAIPNATGPTATTIAQSYSAYPGGYNTTSNLQHVSFSAGTGCISTSAYPTLGAPPCVVYPNSCPSTACNSIQVSSSGYVPTYFAKIFGIQYVQVSATAVATAKGVGAPPFHIMMVLDTTSSMGMGTDGGCTQNGTSYTPEQCAQYGVQTLLSQLDPCYGGLVSCTAGSGGSGTVANPWDEVGLMVFPGLCSSTAGGVTTGNCPTLAGPGGLTNTTANITYAPPDYGCPSTAPPIAAYNNDPEYLLLPFQENYRGNGGSISDTAGLNTSSALFDAIGAGTNNCGVKTPGGEGTFYAGAIQAAQDYLTAYKTANVKNVMIILSDGNATASAAQMGGKVAQIDGPCASATAPCTATHLYPATSECTQAVQAAQYAQNQGTLIYSVSYGSETTGCTSETGSSSYKTPCATMEGMASLPLSQYFFSVPQSDASNPTQTTVCPGAVPLNTLSEVFSNIAGQLTVSRLVPPSDF
jgi:Flp pilus assembly protein TadG